eukprot:TRINITY_DN19165_c3_g1_i1.p1 TRINITY_DN19165_c3_g1~~TRINITY_DN19165_c3_g1_i1.p1  ORF type:complete len:103 (+),score=16.08 TRINITY_DN19165_c3_g1_i1:121-429(+)
MFRARLTALLVVALATPAATSGSPNNEHHCRIAFGYAYCESTHRCIRPLHEACPPIGDIVAQVQAIEESFEGGLEWSSVNAGRPVVESESEKSANHRDDIVV